RCRCRTRGQRRAGADRRARRRPRDGWAADGLACAAVRLPSAFLPSASVRPASVLLPPASVRVPPAVLLPSSLPAVRAVWLRRGRRRASVVCVRGATRVLLVTVVRRPVLVLRTTAVLVLRSTGLRGSASQHGCGRADAQRRRVSERAVRAPWRRDHDSV